MSKRNRSTNENQKADKKQQLDTRQVKRQRYEHCLKCPVCWIWNKTPVILSCGHSLCASCFYHCAMDRSKCPVCKTPVQFSFNNCYALRDIAILMADEEEEEEEEDDDDDNNNNNNCNDNKTKSDDHNSTSNTDTKTIFPLVNNITSKNILLPTPVTNSTKHLTSTQIMTEIDSSSDTDNSNNSSIHSTSNQNINNTNPSNNTSTTSTENNNHNVANANSNSQSNNNSHNNNNSNNNNNTTNSIINTAADQVSPFTLLNVASNQCALNIAKKAVRIIPISLWNRGIYIWFPSKNTSRAFVEQFAVHMKTTYGLHVKLHHTHLLCCVKSQLTHSTSNYDEKRIIQTTNKLHQNCEKSIAVLVHDDSTFSTHQVDAPFLIDEKNLSQFEIFRFVHKQPLPVY